MIMPELPEVESLKIGLKNCLIGKKICNVMLLHNKLVSGKGAKRSGTERAKIHFENGLKDQVFKDVKRIAKNLIFEFESGKILLIHLKMTGQLIYRDEKNFEVRGGHPIKISMSEMPNKHTYVIFELSEGCLFYNDVRMFGYLLLFDSFADVLREGHFEGLGVDPLSDEFCEDDFVLKMRKKKSVLKSVFLEQSVVTGLGNIYADEVCFEAGVRPNRICNSLTKLELLNLFKAIKKIIPLAVSMGGSSVANYLLADGSRGNYAKLHKVYLKGGLPCKVCGNILRKIVVNSRTTVYCEKCQV